MVATAFASTSAEAYRLTRSQRGSQLTAPFLEARAREWNGRRNEVFSPFFDRLIAKHGEPADDLGLSPNLFLRSQRAIVNRADVSAVKGPFLPSRSAGELPAGMFAAFHDELKQTLIGKLKLIEPLAAGLSAMLEEEAVRLAGVDVAAYRHAIGAERPRPADVRFALLTAVDVLFEESRIDASFEVPFVAGYDRDDGSYVMIDCSVPLGPVIQGQFVPVVKLLTLHERIEKALLDEYGLRYQSAHQIALRTEKATSDAMRLRWKSYDDLIASVAERIYARRPTWVADKLDLQPYYSFTDPASIRLAGRMERSTVDTNRFGRLLDKTTWQNRTGSCGSRVATR